jgi:uncharacterized membrane protein YkoI
MTDMKTDTRFLQASIVCILATAALTASTPSCSSNKSGEEGEHAQLMKMGELPPAARATAERLVARGKVEKIDKETEKGRVVYDVEATVDGKHVEYTILGDGSVVGTETSIAFAELPEPVRVAAQSYFGGTEGLHPMLVQEDGRTLYEIEGTKKGNKVEVTLDPAGKVVEEED